MITLSISWYLPAVKKQTQKTNRVKHLLFHQQCSAVIICHVFNCCIPSIGPLHVSTISFEAIKRLQELSKHLNKQFLGNYYFHLFKIAKSLIVNLTKKKRRNYYAPLSKISPWLPCILKSYLGSRTTLTASLSSPTNLWDSLVYYHVSHFIQHKLRLCPIKLCAQPFWLVLMPHFDPEVNALFIRR